MAGQLQTKGEPMVEAVAVTGQGVFETLREVAKLVLAELKKGRLGVIGICAVVRRMLFRPAFRASDSPAVSTRNIRIVFYASRFSRHL